MKKIWNKNNKCYLHTRNQRKCPKYMGSKHYGISGNIEYCRWRSSSSVNRNLVGDNCTYKKEISEFVE